MSYRKLPKDWKILPLGEVCKLKNGYAFKSDNYIDTGIPVIRISDIKDGLIVPRNSVHVSENSIYDSYIINENEIIVAMSGATTGKFGIYKSKNKAYQNQRVGKFDIIDKTVLDNNFLLHQLHSLKRQIEKDAYGGAQPNISSKKIEEMEIVLPQPKTQQVIVSKIEELFSELDKGIEDLKTAQQQLKAYRQSVLKWAFEGKLTNMNVKGGDLPKGWEITTIENVAKKITDGEHFRPQTQSNGIAFLSAKDVRDNGVSFDEPLYISEETAKKALQRCNPQLGDILIVSRGATVGRMCIVNTTKTFCLLGSVILIKVNNKINNLFLNYVLKSPFANQKMITVSGATAQQAIYLRDIKKIEIPLPPIEEQHLIVQEIESRLNVADKMEESIAQSLQQAEALRQSILKKAFSGELF